MAKPVRPVAGKSPKELKDLAKFLESRGYTLALPFDDVRQPGYIGGFNDRSQEIIIDDGECLKGLTTRKPGSVVLGEFKRSSKFSFRSFLEAIGKVLGIDFGFVRVKNVSIKFPGQFLQTEFITVMDLEDHWEKLKPACRKKISDPDNFLILQVLITKAIAYEYKVKKTLDPQAKADLAKVVAAAAKVSKVEATIHYESDTSFTLTIEGKPLSVGYKTATMKFIPLKPQAMVDHRVRAIA